MSPQLPDYPAEDTHERPLRAPDPGEALALKRRLRLEPKWLWTDADYQDYDYDCDYYHYDTIMSIRWNSR